jgi:transposase
MARPHRQVTEAPLVQQVPHRTLRHHDAEPSLDDLLQVDPAPADDTVHRHVRTSLDDRVELGQLLRVQQAARLRLRAIQKPCHALGIVPMHPVAQRLTLHAGRFRGSAATVSVQNRRDRQTAPRLAHALARPRHPSKILRRQIRPRDREAHHYAPAKPEHSESDQNHDVTPEGVGGKRRWYYAPEFRQQMVDLVRAGRDPEDLAREFEPSAQAIRNWVADADRRDGRRVPKPAAADAALTSTERDELARLRRENKQLRLERDILSRAAAWFARETGVVPPGSSHS